ncbi:hypothetical protein SDC9_184300 [bioreactor metagenome]|uniref:Uncharacterized protein n=1 Tax=bioreactor metagenome TaxID=1076179 RepID=A0A645HF48_9ZZZZ
MSNKIKKYFQIAEFFILFIKFLSPVFPYLRYAKLNRLNNAINRHKFSYGNKRYILGLPSRAFSSGGYIRHYFKVRFTHSNHLGYGLVNFCCGSICTPLSFDWMMA